jgi:hypothetical protein
MFRRMLATELYSNDVRIISCVIDFLSGVYIDRKIQPSPRGKISADVIWGKSEKEKKKRGKM